MLKTLLLLVKIFTYVYSDAASDNNKAESLRKVDAAINNVSADSINEIVPEYRDSFEYLDHNNRNDFNPNAGIQCNQEMMITYGLDGYTTAQVSKHKYCPAINQNCCTPDDEEASHNLWNNQVRFFVERYYETYLYSVKYILGFSQEIYLLAREFETSDDVKCKNAAVDYISINFNGQNYARCL